MRPGNRRPLPDRTHSGTAPAARLPIRAAFLSGVGVVFALWLASSAYLIQRLDEIEARSVTAHTRYDRGQALLLTVRAQVLLGSVLVRDALEEPDVALATSYRHELWSIRERIERALAQYLPEVDLPAEREHWARLGAELDTYWTTMLPVLEGERGGAIGTSTAFLRTQVVPRRELVIAISERIRALNEEGFRQERHHIDGLYADARRRVWTLNGAGVLLGFAIVAVAARYAGRLEFRIHRQHADALQNRQELRQLSAELVRARETERQAIARELHDEIGQVLTAIDVDLALAQRQTRAPEQTAASIADARAGIERAIRTIQDLSELLHPAMLDHFGLPDTLASHLRSFADRTGIRAEWLQDGIDGRLAPELEVCVYRIVQEALTNVVRHARATSIRVRLQRQTDVVTLVVEDDGVGLPPETAAGRRGLGLVGIRERAAAFGGAVRLVSRPGQGTQLVVELAARAAGEHSDPAAERRPIAAQA